MRLRCTQRVGGRSRRRGGVSASFASVLVLCHALSAGAAGQTPEPVRPAMDASLAEATFRAVIALTLQDVAPDDAPAVLCLALGNADAPDSVLTRLSDVRPPVRPASACRLGPGGEIVERASGRPAWDITVHTAVTPRATNEVALDASYYVAPMWAAGWRCIARRERTRWTVECHGTWVSLAPAGDARSVWIIHRNARR